VVELGGLGPALARIVAEGGVAAPGRICQACLAVLPVTRAAVTVMTSADRQEPVWASDDVASHLDELQFSLGEGPCVEAFTEGRPVLVPDLAELTGHRWPMFADAARQTTVQALFVLPLQAGALVIGVLDLYRDEPGMLHPDEPGMLHPNELAAALRTADALLWALLGLRGGQGSAPGDGGRGVDPSGWLSGSPLNHTAVYQATGMVMAQLTLSPEAALSRLRASAFVQGRAIDAVAGDVVARRLRFDEEER
jgi:putative methionine-R-sulfoxide reductase with GAF domain